MAYKPYKSKSPRERAEVLLSLLVSDWRPTPRQALWATRIGIVLSFIVAVGYPYGVTIWDWINLLIVPAVIAGGGLWFNSQQRAREQQIANDRAQDEALQSYLDQISQLLIDERRPLHRASPGDNLATVARARTLTVLPRLDGNRKGRVVQFLYESGLIAKHHPIVLLNGADLRNANLQGGRLRGASLRRTDLQEANLGGADLRDADLSYADLRRATLWGADPGGANVTGARLVEANLSDPFLGALKSRTWTDEQLSAADSLSGATMPNRQKYEDWLKTKGHHGKDGKYADP